MCARPLLAGNTDPACNYLPHLLPVDRSLHWANPEQLPCIEPGKTKDCAPDPTKLTNPAILKQPYLGPVPMVVHVHGAHAGPEADGYAEAWWLPNANNIPDGYATTGTYVNQFGVATNNPARPGVGTFTYPNSQPSSTVWYHDHSLGMTRSNVYAGPAGFWILRDPAAPSKETGLVSGTLPGPAPVAGQAVLDLNVPGNPVRAAVREIPIAIQDRSFNFDGSLFYPDNRAFFEGLAPADLQIPFIGDPTPSDIAAIWNPEAFFNTMVVNGVTWPTLEVEPDIYRFRLLDGCNSRMLNLALFEVDPVTNEVDPTKEIPFYQIGAEQSLLPKVVKIETGFRTVLPGGGTPGTRVKTASPLTALLMGNAERADVLVDFSGLLPGTRVRMINTGPDEPFGGFPVDPTDPLTPYTPSDPGTTGQVMEFMVVADNTEVGEGATPPESLVLSPVEGVNDLPEQRLANINPVHRDQALLEEVSLLVCVTVDSVSGAIIQDPERDSKPGRDRDLRRWPRGGRYWCVPLRTQGRRPGHRRLRHARSHPMVRPDRDQSPVRYEREPADRDLGVLEPHRGRPPDPRARDQVQGHQPRRASIRRPAWIPRNGPRPPEATEAGWKDTVIAYPGEVTRIAATFDLQGLYVWHCHIVEHEDNEMMVPYCIGNKDPALGPIAPGCALAPPVAVDDSYTTNEDTTLTVAAPGVLTNDTDINVANTLTAKLVTGPTSGTLTLNPDGSFTYTPNANFNGSDSFTYKANDGSADSPTAATVTITVTAAVNNAPVAVNDAYSMTQDAPLTVAAPGVLANDTDVEGTALAAALVSGPANGTVVLASNGGFIYTPKTGFTGTDTFIYGAFDGAALSNEATVTITVNPAASPQLYLSLTNATGTLTGLGPNGSDLVYANEDILSWNGVSYAMVFDGTAAGLPASANISAFDIDTANNRILMAFGADTLVPGVGAVTGSDIVAYNRGTGTFSLVFDGSDVGLGGGTESLDALQLLPDGRLVVSTRGLTSVPSGKLLPYCRCGPGSVGIHANDPRLRHDRDLGDLLRRVGCRSLDTWRGRGCGFGRGERGDLPEHAWKL